MKHGDLVNQCLLVLAEHGIAWSNATGALKDASGRLVRYGLNGSSDILACIKGRFVGVECKVGRDRQSDTQKRFEQAVTRHDGIYILARSVEDVTARLNAEGLL